MVGLTGGIASGKSTVSRMFSDLGVRVIDADLLAREVVTKGSPALKEIAEAFGEEVIAPDGTLDRGALGARIFGDRAARSRLESITHPRIASLTAERTRQAHDEGHDWVIYDAALIVENALHEAMYRLIVVALDETTQLRRLIQRDETMTEEEARARIASQLPLCDKIAVADHVIDNGGTREQTREQVENLHDRLRREIESIRDV